MALLAAVRTYNRISGVRFIVAIAVLLVLAGVTGCGTTRNYTDPNGPMWSGKSKSSPSYRGKAILVVTYNIELAEKIDLAIEEIEHDSVLRSADFYLLQEMDPAGVERMARHFDLNYVYYPAVVHAKNDKDYGDAVLSRWPLSDQIKIILPHRDPIRKQIRIGTAVTAVIGERKVRVVSTHTEMYRLGTQERIEQIDSLINSIDPTLEYVIVGGDFNTVRQDILERYDRIFENSGFQRATEGIARTARSDPFGLIPLDLDHIYTKGFLVTSQGKIADTKSSDHYPVWVELRFAGGK